MSDSEPADYDDDFECASDDDEELLKSRLSPKPAAGDLLEVSDEALNVTQPTPEAESNAAAAAALTATAFAPSAAQGPAPSGGVVAGAAAADTGTASATGFGQGIGSARGPRPRRGEPPPEATPARPPPPPVSGISGLVGGGELPKASDEAVEMAGPPTGGRRPVRGRVSVSGEEERRPGTGDSGRQQKPGTGDSAVRQNSSNRPMWLQHDPTPPLRQHKSGELFPRPAEAERRRVVDSGTQDARDGGDRHGGNAGADDRKVKRQQQEIQRLQQRLNEAERFSAQDDGLPTFKLDEVELGREIGLGGFSSVHHATWHCTPCAIKKIFDPVITDELRADFENEVRMLRRLRHPHIVTIMAVCRQPPALSLLTEYIDGGSLFEMLHGKGESTPDYKGEALPVILQQASAALAYLHAVLVVHRDVKSHNILLGGGGSRPHAKLCDFGLARMKSELCIGTMQWAGTAAYMAPELFEKKKRYTEAVDVFAFGVLIWEAAAGDIPHANLEAADIFHRISQKDGAGLQISRSWPGRLKSLLCVALAVSHEERPPMTEVLSQLKAIGAEFPNPLQGSH
eukprot:gnl/TRDRNA2_/TRDRNA2_44770_c0_seq1.p1 gnl/TRDRNA2_/TRDRNA2_44770_c0~~gnl/TRDRNA2_/TRDRNA2_44770_c0_seq1.p1  ORF type:complete len:570 (+),score=140.15 gnl/TRDRNA2_/TRDRNA2_44770_c0_seq1:99-1808(+)